MKKRERQVKDFFGKSSAMVFIKEERDRMTTSFYLRKVFGNSTFVFLKEERQTRVLKYEAAAAVVVMEWALLPTSCILLKEGVGCVYKNPASSYQQKL